MLENYSRMKSFPAMPRLRMAHVDEFFDSLPRKGLPKWTGELYLELHRGTLTTQARVKKLNREAEHRLLEAEALATLAALHGGEYQREELEAAWKTLLLNQFHDILPGTSIGEVYDVAHKELADVVRKAQKLRDTALSPPPEAEPALLVANVSLNPRPLSVLLDAESKPEDTSSVADADGRPLPTQETEGGGLLVHAPDLSVPGLGWSTLTARHEFAPTPRETQDVGTEVADGRAVLDNGLLRVEVGEDGTLHGVFDRVAGREVLAGRANQLWAYTDKPRNWEAWDVDEGYEQEGEEISSVESVEVTESGPLRASVRVVRRWRGSTIVQTYRLLSGSRRLDVESYVDWRERRILLRTLFPLAVRSHETTSETMFGALRRPTHHNTPWDATRFEVSAHRFCDLSEPGYGVALLNDGKYGHSAKGNVVGISLLRSPLYPDPFADEGEHRFTYSLFPHIGDWTAAGVTREAFALNAPLFPVRAQEDALSRGFSLVEAEGLELALGSLKLAEHGDSVILRLYEPHGARGECTLRFGRPVERVERVNLLEEAEGPVEVYKGAVRLRVQPFEVVTLRVEWERQ
jgi:alpha-mannosidase